jgi:predicted molibdopterin-dependent oxidoreductase YjgC
MALGNLALLTGNVGKPSSGVNPLRGQNNVQGACDMGSLPDVFTGYQKVANPEVKEKFEKAWSTTLDSNPGLTITEMFDGAADGRVKAMYVVGENPVLTEPSASHAVEALKELEFLVVQDMFLTETARLAHVVLPAASFAEKDGSFTNTERRVQRVRQVVEPTGDSRADWLIIAQVARKMGASGFDYSSASDVMEEVASLTPSSCGISLERLEDTSLQWPCPSPDHPGTPILHIGAFSRGKGKFVPLKYVPPTEPPDEEFPLVLTTGRSLFQYHTGTMTRKVKGLNALSGEEWVEINPADASKLDVADGDSIRVVSRRGRVTARARLTDASPPGVVFMTFHFAESPTNVLTNPALDPVSKTPELKVAAVRVEKAGA